MAVIEFLRDFNIATVIIRLVFAAVLGGIIGLERGKHGHPAGVRTHMLVCLGAAMAMMVGLFLVEQSGYSSDPARIGAQVVSGIGFLGVGTILVKGKDRITGLTTAAAIWAAGAIGLSCGAGFYEAAIIGVIIILVVMAILKRYNEHLKAPSDIIIYIELDDVNNVNQLHDNLQADYGDIPISPVPSRSGIAGHIGLEVIFTYKNNTIPKLELIKKIRDYNGVSFAIEAN